MTFGCKDRNIFILKNESFHCFVQLIRKTLGRAASLGDMDDLPSEALGGLMHSLIPLLKTDLALASVASP